MDEQPADNPEKAPDKPEKARYGIPPIMAGYWMVLADKARELGYALAVHGSMNRDLDFIACPWTDDAVCAEELVFELAKACGFYRRGSEWKPEENINGSDPPVIKPHGRIAWGIWIGEHHWIDLSIMPRRNPNMTTKWIPEAPSHPGLYANLSDDSGQGKIHDKTNLQPSTFDIHKARQFDTYDECQVWCNENPYPVFKPVSHGFY